MNRPKTNKKLKKKKKKKKKTEETKDKQKITQKKNEQTKSKQKIKNKKQKKMKWNDKDSVISDSFLFYRKINASLFEGSNYFIIISSISLRLMLILGRKRKLVLSFQIRILPFLQPQRVGNNESSHKVTWMEPWSFQFFFLYLTKMQISFARMIMDFTITDLKPSFGKGRSE